MTVEIIKDWACFGGRQQVFRHASPATGTPMEVAVFTPPPAGNAKLPVLVFLSGLTCSWENFTTKAGAQRYAAEHGLILVMPDTSPRGAGVPDNADYDLGQGAGFYVDATEAPWAENFRMWSYVTEELPALLPQLAPQADAARIGIAGHSMGGHGALVAALRRPDVFRSVSAIAPIVAPSQVPWGEQAFAAYLGEDRRVWAAYDATALVQAGHKPAGHVLIDQGGADEFLDSQLQPQRFKDACAAADVPLTLTRHDGYDHSYYFIATVIGGQIAHHARCLAAS